MSDLFRPVADLFSGLQPGSGRRICPANPFVEFKPEEIEQTIGERFEQQVARYPDRLAVKTRSHQFTYEALNQAANRVAQAILAKEGAKVGAGEQRVAVLLEHGGPLIAALLGVVKAGKVCVPLDPSFPEARASQILDDAEADIIVTNERNLPLAQRLAQGVRQLINMDELDSRTSAENPRLPISPDAFAYILYTSGSTGRPKGVIKHHLNILRGVMASTNGFHICPDDRITLLASCSGAQGIGTAFNALLTGAALYPLDLNEERLTGLSTWLITEGMTIYRSAATVFRHFVKTLTGEEEFPHLRLIVLGNEPIRKTDVELYQKHFSPPCLFVNLLAATEIGSFSLYLVDQETEITSHLVPVGYPSEDVEVLLLDDAGQDVGCNCIGEIAVKSRCLSPGYWRQPDLTQAAFLPVPGGDEKIYLTGDLGLRRPDGCLEHLGRKDLQVKIRGFRIELEEIEDLLGKHPGVQGAVLEAKEDGHGDNRLVAYLVPDREQAPTISQLRGYLKESLPEHMVPSAFVFLDALPLTPNGKVDRRALPLPDQARPALDRAFAVPRNSAEEMLARIWAEVLKLERVGIHDNFLELGGNSLLATQVTSRVGKAFEVELPLRSLFESPTVASLAEVIAQHQAEQAGAEKLTSLLAELKELSEEEAQQILDIERL